MTIELTDKTKGQLKDIFAPLVSQEEGKFTARLLGNVYVGHSQISMQRSAASEEQAVEEIWNYFVARIEDYVAGEGQPVFVFNNAAEALEVVTYTNENGFESQIVDTETQESVLAGNGPAAPGN